MELILNGINHTKRIIYLILVGLLVTGLFAGFVYSITSTPVVLEARGGKQNLWDDELSPLKPQALKDLWDEAQALGNSELVHRVQKERKRRGREIGKNADWGGQVK